MTMDASEARMNEIMVSPLFIKMIKLCVYLGSAQHAVPYVHMASCRMIHCVKSVVLYLTPVNDLFVNANGGGDERQDY